jgi:hypothetical protein
VAAGGLRGEVREYGRFANTFAALDRLPRKLGGDGTTLRFCYEAGPCGYGIHRRLSTRGHECVVVAPLAFFDNMKLQWYCTTHVSRREHADNRSGGRVRRYRQIGNRDRHEPLRIGTEPAIGKSARGSLERRSAA